MMANIMAKPAASGSARRVRTAGEAACATTGRLEKPALTAGPRTRASDLLIMAAKACARRERACFFSSFDRQ
jgi:hypothetical protein